MKMMIVLVSFQTVWRMLMSIAFALGQMMMMAVMLTMTATVVVAAVV